MDKASPLFRLLTVIVILSFVMSACTNTANFKVNQLRQIDKSQLGKVVVIPILPILELSQNEFLAGEKEFSNLARSFFETPSCVVISAEQVRKDLKIQPSDGNISIEKIAGLYGPDCMLTCGFDKLVKYGTWGQIANGYFQGYIMVKILDKNAQVISDCIGFVHAETGAGFPPDFNTFINLGFSDLKPKLLDAFQ
jgi:hypothetical protein